jgi:hypothetical protein
VEDTWDRSPDEYLCIDASATMGAIAIERQANKKDAERRASSTRAGCLMKKFPSTKKRQRIPFMKARENVKNAFTKNQDCL